MNSRKAVACLAMLMATVSTASSTDHRPIAKAGNVTDGRVIAETRSRRNWLVRGGNFGSG